MKILTIIPARGGSKGIPNKNIKILNGKPLLAYSIEQALETSFFKSGKMRIIVSTDSNEYGEIAKKYGAEVPFIRPKEISGDLSTDFECISHCMRWLEENEYYKPDIILQLRPTQPCRKIEDIEKTLDIFIENYNEYDSLRTIIPLEKSAYKMYNLEGNDLKPLFPIVNINGIEVVEPFNQARQILPKCYLHNGYIDILNPKILKRGMISGEKIYGYLMNKEDTIDIDTIEDWNNLEKFLNK
jgi:N-acylneuraminate cytidylyltransferase